MEYLMDPVFRALLVAAIAVIGLYVLVGRWLSSRSHQHQCPSCGAIWEHDPQLGLSEAAHECPQCSTKQRWIYLGSRQSTHRSK